MVVVKIIGGLGNQMFQYAAALELAMRYSSTPKLDISGMKSYKVHNFGLDKFNVNLEYYNENCYNKFLEIIKIKLFGKYYKEVNFTYNDIFEKLRSDVYLDGYFQSPRYFNTIREKLLVIFKPKLKLKGINLNFLKYIESNNSVALHVRRGDYLSNKSASKIHGLCNENYYINSIKYISKRVTSPSFIIFSDDLNWVKNNLHINFPCLYIDGNVSNPEIDIFLMSKCKHHIIANSSFSWWGAWLSTNDNGITIRPQPWFLSTDLSEKDLIPHNWVSISRS